MSKCKGNNMAHKRLWPIELNETTSYEEQVLWLIKKVKELEDRVTVLEGEVNEEDD